jgi:hypothetical protein
MAVNNSRSMNAEFHQGHIDRSYIQLTPDRGNVEHPPVERLLWPTYGQAELHAESPFIEAHIVRANLPVEYLTGSSHGDSDLRAE